MLTCIGAFQLFTLEISESIWVMSRIHSSVLQSITAWELLSNSTPIFWNWILIFLLKISFTRRTFWTFFIFKDFETLYIQNIVSTSRYLGMIDSGLYLIIFYSSYSLVKSHILFTSHEWHNSLKYTCDQMILIVIRSYICLGVSDSILLINIYSCTVIFE